MPINNIILAADNYNLEAGDRGWFDSTVDGFTAAAGSTYYTTKNSVSWIFNGVSNLTRSEEEQVDFIPQDAGQGLAEAGFADAASYYNEHRQGLDAIGLIASSLIPGTLGIKALRVAERSTRILDEVGMSLSALEKTRDAARAAAGVGTSVFNPLHGATMKAISSGVGVNIMESFAFEIAALSTTIASPVYDQMDAGDMFENSLIFGLAGGAIGGAFSAAKTVWQVRGAAKEAGLAAQVFETGSEFTKASNNVLVMKATGTPEAKLVPEIRRMAGNDDAISGQLFPLIQKQTPDATASVFGFAKDVKRMADVTIEDKAATRQFIDLKTGMVTDDAKNIRAGLGDTITAAQRVSIVAERKVAAVIDTTTGKIVRSIDGSKPLAQATVEEAHVSWLAAAELPLPRRGISSNDIPMLEKWVREGATDVPVDGSVGMGIEDARVLLQERKRAAMQELITVRGEEVSTAQRILNMPETEARNAPLWNHDVRDVKALRESFETPRYGAISYDTAGIPKDALFTAQALRWAENQNMLRSQELDIDSAEILGSIGFGSAANSLTESAYAKSLVNTASAASEGAGAFSFANGAVGSITAWAQNTGRLVQKMITELRAKNSEAVYKAIQPILKDSQLADELILTVNKMRLTDTHYVLLDGKIVRLDVAKARVKPADFQVDTTLNAAKNPEELSVSEPVLEFLATHSKINLDSYRRPSSKIATAQGYWDVKAHERFKEFTPLYVPPVDMSKQKYFVLVRQDPELFGADSGVSAITARSAEELEQKIARARNLIEADGDDVARYQFLTKDNTKAYFQALGSYQYARAINSSRVDSTLRRAGVLGEERPLLQHETNGKAVRDMAEDFLHWHGKMSARTIRDTVEMRYAEPFRMLQARGTSLLELETSKAQNVTQSAIESIKNPYQDVIKTALDLSTFNEYDNLGWVTFNRTLENIGSQAMGAIGRARDAALDVFSKRGGKLTETEMDAALQEVNATAKRLGMPGGYEAAARNIYADSITANPSFSRAISRGNGLISLFALGLDAIQALNNAVGLAVMQNAEMGSIMNAIAKKNPAVAGDLAMVKMPGTSSAMVATAKLNAASIKRYFQGGRVWQKDDDGPGRWVMRTGKELLEEYEREGIVLTELHQLRQVMDNLSFTGGETAATLQKNITDSIMQLGEKGRTLTGNNFAERFTRFVAADAMRQITDHGMAQKVISTPAEAKVYWNTAVNRIQGNMVASQRPIAFQGAAGQAIGLFMTYQVNLMQQLFRYAGTGDKKALGMLLGTQTALYGTQGLPGWNFINTKLIADAEGNTGHSDLYSAVNSATGKETADWLLYGLGSNMLGLLNPELKFNLYTRGDINPRTLTVLPTDATETILYKTTLGFIGNTLETARNIGNGAPVDQALFMGLQHNGINRPFAGMGAILAGATYTSDGKMIAPVEESITQLSWSNMVRLMGAKPMDDAIAADAMFRTRAYDAADKAKRDALAEAVRLEAADGAIDPDKLEDFAASYAKTGGNPENFRRFLLGKLKDQEQSIVEQSAVKMREPLFQNFARVIGADEPDFEWKQRRLEVDDEDMM